MARPSRICYGCFELFYPDKPSIRYCSAQCKNLAAWEKREARLLDEGADDKALETHRRAHPKYHTRQTLSVSAHQELAAYTKAMGELRKERIKSNAIDHIDLQELIERDNRRCHLCGGKVSARKKFGKRGTPRGDMKTYPTIDHIVPVSKGGTHTWGNVKLAHWSCNSKRGATDPLTSFPQYVA